MDVVVTSSDKVEEIAYNPKCVLTAVVERMYVDVEALACTQREHLVRCLDCWAADLQTVLNVAGNGTFDEARSLFLDDTFSLSGLSPSEMDEWEPLNIEERLGFASDTTESGDTGCTLAAALTADAWTSPPVPLTQTLDICTRNSPTGISSTSAESSATTLCAGAPALEETGPASVIVRDSTASTACSLESAERQLQETCKSILPKKRTRKPDSDWKSVGVALSSCPSEHEHVHRSRIKKLTTSAKYENIMLAAIILNAAFVGFQTQYLALKCVSNTGHMVVSSQWDEQDYVFWFCHMIFFMVFLADLAARWIADGFTTFFRCSDKVWNMVDMLTVVSSMTELVLDLAHTDPHVLVNTSLLRIVRVVRVFRVIRVIRVVLFFRELRLMLYSLVSSMKQLMWVIVVFSLIFYMFGLVFTWAVYEYCMSEDRWKQQEDQDLILYFGTLDRSAMTLFMSVSGGQDWEGYYTALGRVSAGTQAVYILYLAFTIVSAMNVVTGVFVDASMRIAEKDRDFVIQEELHEKTKYMASMHEVFNQINASESGCMTIEEFESYLHDARAMAYFKAMQLDFEDARTVFKLLDADGSGFVDMTEFIEGCDKIKGDARSIDVALLRSDVRCLTQYVLERFPQIEFGRTNVVRVEHETLDFVGSL
eukprot:TRINITY_DN68598_c0_g1_i1.p1 TRINITY_DN68598_c0_g1~~TRINITY_DN68598_c0_g1_i1.p1  ORF type:complete len:651 (-),score=98.56 TRINITY_DN68598_c0_g1_i1:36-1988(-)